jgi:hypothetical protein
MLTRTLLSLSLLALLLACGGAAQQAPPPTPVAPPSMQDLGDPLAEPAVKPFATAYLALFCKANYGFDSEATVGAVREPIKHMRALAEVDSGLLVGYLQVLEENGFATLGAFDQRAAELQNQPGLWEKLQERTMERLENCQ